MLLSWKTSASGSVLTSRTDAAYVGDSHQRSNTRLRPRHAESGPTVPTRAARTGSPANLRDVWLPAPAVLCATGPAEGRSHLAITHNLSNNKSGARTISPSALPIADINHSITPRSTRVSHART